MVHLVAERYVLVIAGLLTVLCMLCVPAAADEHHISPGTGAIQAGVNAASSGDVIVLARGTYSEHNIVITGKSLTLRPETGLTASDVTIDGTGTAPRIFTVTDGSALTIERISIQNGEATSGSDGAAGENGGAILSGGPVTILSSVITMCSAGSGGGRPAQDGGSGGSGGVIFTTGPVTVTSTSFSFCYAGGGGSGASDYGRGGAGGSGGAIRAGGDVLITGSEFLMCSAGRGGGGAEGGSGGSGGAVWSSGSVTATLSSFELCNAGSGGSASQGIAGNGGSGGAIHASGTVTVPGTSITSCMAGSGGSRGGLDAHAGSGGSGGGVFTAGTVAMSSSSVTSCSAGNRGSGDTYGTPGTGSAVYSGASGGSLNFCRIYANQRGQTVYANGMNAENTWWGTSAGAGTTVTGADTAPWLILGITASPSVVTPSSYWSTITADLNRNSDGALVSGSGHVPDGTPVAFSGTAGTVLPASATTTLGTATTVFTPSAGGTATVRATVDSQSETTTLNVIAPVDAAFSASPLTGTAPLTVAFTDESTGSPDQWVWNFGSYAAGDQGVSLARNPTHAYDAAGTYTVTLTAKAGVTGDTVSRVGYITVTDSGTDPIAAAFTADPPLTGYAPLTVQFHDGSTGLPVAWAWSFGDGDTSSDRNPSHTYSLPGAYTVTLTAMNGSVSGTHAEPGYVTVTSVDTPVVANFANATPRDGTVPLTVQFTDTSAGLPVAWLWSFGDGGTSTDQHPSHTYTAAGSYTITITAVNGTHANTLTQPGYVTVTAVPTPVPTTLPTTAPAAAPANPPSSGANSGTTSAGSDGSDSDTGPAPVKKENIVLSVDSSYLAEHSVAPADIRIMSYAGGRWAGLDTRYTGSSGNRFYFTSESDAYSLLALGNTKDGITGLPVIGSTATQAPTIFRTPATSPSPATTESHVIPREETTAPAVQQPVAERPVTAAASVPTASSGFPLMTIITVIAGCIVLISSGWYVRRWWIRRQNPALFREYD